MKPFRLVPDLPLKERARKKNAMLNRLEKEKLAKIDANVGAGPELANPMVPCEVCGWSFPKAARHNCKKKHEVSHI